jgi:hypothetical protein
VTLECLPPILGIVRYWPSFFPKNAEALARWILWILDSLFARRRTTVLSCMYVHAHGVIHCIAISPFLPEHSNRGESPSCGTRVVGDPPAESFATRTPYQRVGCPVYSFLLPAMNCRIHPPFELQSRLFHWALLLVVLQKGICGRDVGDMWALDVRALLAITPAERLLQFWYSRRWLLTLVMGSPEGCDISSYT